MSMEPETTGSATEAVRPALLAYLGGRLTPDQRDHFEQRMLGDEAFSQTVEEAEFALVEDFAAGALSPEERFAVEPWIASSVERSAQVAIARTLRHRQQPTEWQQVPAWQADAGRDNVVSFGSRSRAVAPGAAAMPAPTPMTTRVAAPPEPKIVSVVRRRSPWRVIAPLAAAAAIAVSVFVLRDHRSGADTASNTPAVVKPAAPAGHDTSVPPAANGLVDSDLIRLSAGDLHAATAAAQSFRLRAGHPVEVRIAIPETVAGQSFSLSLQTPGKPGLLQQNLRANTAGVPPVIDFTVPPYALLPGRYVGELKSSAGRFPLRFTVEP